jgi:hypothetical protein
MQAQFSSNQYWQESCEHVTMFSLYVLENVALRLVLQQNLARAQCKMLQLIYPVAHGKDINRVLLLGRAFTTFTTLVHVFTISLYCYDVK